MTTFLTQLPHSVPLGLPLRVPRYEGEQLFVRLRVEGPHKVAGADASSLQGAALRDRQAAQQVPVVLHCQEESEPAVVK